MRPVTRPTRHDVVVTTFVVIVAVAFFGIFFFGVDSTVGYVLQRVFNFFKH
jgi:preprotein translocase SecE subunit